jgi:hypothetical protein
MNKSEVIRAKATPVERRALELLASQNCQKMSETLRTIVRDAARSAGVWESARATESQAQSRSG